MYVVIVLEPVVQFNAERRRPGTPFRVISPLNKGSWYRWTINMPNDEDTYKTVPTRPLRSRTLAGTIRSLRTTWPMICGVGTINSLCSSGWVSSADSGNQHQGARLFCTPAKVAVRYRWHWRMTCLRRPPVAQRHVYSVTDAPLRSIGSYGDGTHCSLSLKPNMFSRSKRNIHGTSSFCVYTSISLNISIRAS